MRVSEWVRNLLAFVVFNDVVGPARSDQRLVPSFVCVARGMQRFMFSSSNSYQNRH